MLELLGAWLAFPLLSAAACLGLGLLVERLAGLRLDGVLLLPLGFAALIVLAQLVTFADPLAELATVAVVVAALAGLWLGRARWWPPRPCGWALAAALVVFGAYAAPIVLSGEATFAGYTLLGDTSIHLILSDWVGREGPHLGLGLPESSYSVALNAYLDGAYPTGTHAALAALRPFGFQALPWVYQPFLALAATMAALAVYGLVRAVIRPPALRALAAALAALPGLVYGYYLQGSVKEVVMAALLPLLAAVAVRLADRDATGRRAAIPVAVVAAAALGSLQLAAAPYVGPLGLVAAGALLLRRAEPARDRLVRVAALGALTALLALPVLVAAPSFLRTAEVSLTSGEEVGNLLEPLRPAQALGVWPRGDYRLPLVEDLTAAYLLMGAVALGALFGVLFLLRRPDRGTIAFGAAVGIGSAYAIARGSPWADGKAYMLLSPAVMVAAFAGVESLRRARRTVEALLVAAAIAAGVVWTDALAHAWADLAPRDRLEQLADIGERIAGQGPTLYPEFEEFAKFFLRDAQPVGSSESWQPAERGRLAGGGASGFGFSYELDQLDPAYVAGFRTIVLRRSPVASRPPAGWARVLETESYEVWQRRGDAEVLAHRPLGDVTHGRAAPACGDVEALAAQARRERGALAAVPRPPVAAFLTSRAQLPPGWAVDGADPLAVRPAGEGRVEGTVEVPAAGRHEVWLQGSFSRPVAVEVDGRRVGAVKPRLSPRGGWERVGEVELAAGAHAVAIVRPPAGLGPGERGANRLLGPLVLRPVPDTTEVRTVRPDGARSLCGETADWLEVVRP